MIVYGLKQDEAYVGFGVSNDLAMEISDWFNTTVQVTAIADAEEQTARNISDWLTHMNGPGPFVSKEQYQITDETPYTLTEAGTILFGVQ